MYRAKIESPLGPILLCAESSKLTGLYFLDQKDCPETAGQIDVTEVAFGPSTGYRDGVPLKVLRPNRRATTTQASSLTTISETSKQPIVPAQEGTPSEVMKLFDHAQRQLNEYFFRERKEFFIPLKLLGTPFQIKIWNALCRVAYGEVISYGQLAVLAGLTPGHSRAVGAAVGRNPISIIVPCHRIIGTNRMLTGYSGGLNRKVGLLETEGFELLARAAAS